MAELMFLHGQVNVAATKIRKMDAPADGKTKGHPWADEWPSARAAATFWHTGERVWAFGGRGTVDGHDVTLKDSFVRDIVRPFETPRPRGGVRGPAV